MDTTAVRHALARATACRRVGAPSEQEYVIKTTDGDIRVGRRWSHLKGWTPYIQFGNLALPVASLQDDIKALLALTLPA